MRREELEAWAADAAVMLEAAVAYSEAMRAHGKGMTWPTGRAGHSVDAVIWALRQAVADACPECDGVMVETCPECGVAAPEAEVPVTFSDTCPVCAHATVHDLMSIDPDEDGGTGRCRECGHHVTFTGNPVGEAR